MNKLSSVALSAALLLAGVSASVSAEARPYVRDPFDWPVGAAGPVGYARPYDYGARGGYWHHEFNRFRFDRFHHEPGHGR